MSEASDQITRSIELEEVDLLQLFGMYDVERRRIEQTYGVTLISRAGALIIQGGPASTKDAERELVERLRELRGGAGAEDEVRETPRQSITELLPTPMPPLNAGDSSGVIITTANSKPVAPKSRGQKRYVEAVWKHDIVFAIGPAGTGKTYLAVAMAVAALKSKAVMRIVLARPAVEAGERLGFLPGDLQEKVDPYLRPIYDSLYDLLSADKLRRYMESHIIEVVPLAFMRGRTLNNAFVILDEAQNTTDKQMKMFLTRLGNGSKAVVTGDTTQIDLHESEVSGLAHARKVLEGVKGIAVVELDEKDVVRHRLVQSIIRAYDRFENPSENASRNTDHK